jgi:hypothetical protein
MNYQAFTNDSLTMMYQGVRQRNGGQGNALELICCRKTNVTNYPPVSVQAFGGRPNLKTAMM